MIENFEELEPNFFSDDRELHEECGVFGVFGVDKAAELTYYGLHALQHRGQEGCGLIGGGLFSMVFMSLGYAFYRGRKRKA